MVAAAWAALMRDQRAYQQGLNTLLGRFGVSGLCVSACVFVVMVVVVGGQQRLMMGRGDGTAVCCR